MKALHHMKWFVMLGILKEKKKTKKTGQRNLVLQDTLTWISVCCLIRKWISPLGHFFTSAKIHSIYEIHSYYNYGQVPRYRRGHYFLESPSNWVEPVNCAGEFPYLMGPKGCPLSSSYSIPSSEREKFLPRNKSLCPQHNLHNMQQVLRTCRKMYWVAADSARHVACVYVW